MRNRLDRTICVIQHQLIHTNSNWLCFKMRGGISIPNHWCQGSDKVLKENYFCKIWHPKSHHQRWRITLLQQGFWNPLTKYEVKHKVATTYYPQTSKPARISNWEIKKIIEKVVSSSKKEWSLKLDDALWAYRQLLRHQQGMSPYRLVFGKAYPPTLRARAQRYWVIQKLSFDVKVCSKKRLLELNELDELRLNAYENVKMYKKRTKLWHDRHTWPSLGGLELTQ